MMKNRRGLTGALITFLLAGCVRGDAIEKLTSPGIRPSFQHEYFADPDDPLQADILPQHWGSASAYFYSYASGVGSQGTLSYLWERFQNGQYYPFDVASGPVGDVPYFLYIAQQSETFKIRLTITANYGGNTYVAKDSLEVSLSSTNDPFSFHCIYVNCIVP